MAIWMDGGVRSLGKTVESLHELGSFVVVGEGRMIDHAKVAPG